MKKKKALILAWLIFLVLDALVCYVLYIFGLVDFSNAVTLFFVGILGDRVGEKMRKRMRDRQ